MRYLIVIEKAGKNFSAYAPDVPGCGTVGDTVAQAKRNMREALGLHLHGLVKDGEKIPESVSVADYVSVEALPDEQVLDLRDVARKAREKLGMSQAEFAQLLGVPLATLRNWEQGRTAPDGPGRALLRIAAEHPETVLQSLHAKRNKRAG